jgi:DNA-binding NarL/FixJ family response regulator
MHALQEVTSWLTVGGNELANGERVRGPILIADDDEAFVAYVQTLLETAGYRTLTVSTGGQAVGVARKEMPSVVLLDIELPVMNGYEVCRALRDEFGLRVAIVFVTGTRVEQLDVSSGLLFGADDYLVKPFDPGELLGRVCALVRRVEDHEEGSAPAGAENLTNRELEVLSLLANGRDQGNIAQTLSISRRTVGVHIEHILEKLGVHSRAQAVAAAYRERLIAP